MKWFPSLLFFQISSSAEYDADNNKKKQKKGKNYIGITVIERMTKKRLQNSPYSELNWQFIHQRPRKLRNTIPAWYKDQAWPPPAFPFLPTGPGSHKKILRVAWCLPSTIGTTEGAGGWAGPGVLLPWAWGQGWWKSPISREEVGSVNHLPNQGESLGTEERPAKLAREEGWCGGWRRRWRPTTLLVGRECSSPETSPFW